MRENIYEPFRKKYATIKYINNETNHPQNFRNTINPMINYRLSKLSCDMQVFHDRVKPYNEALKRSGFYKLRGYMDSESIRKKQKEKRKT